MCSVLQWALESQNASSLQSSKQSQVSCTKECYSWRTLLQKRPAIISIQWQERVCLSEEQYIASLLCKRALFVTGSSAKETCCYIDTIAGAGLFCQSAIHSRSLLQKSHCMRVCIGIICKRDVLMYNAHTHCHSRLCEKMSCCDAVRCKVYCEVWVCFCKQDMIRFCSLPGVLVGSFLEK